MYHHTPHRHLERGFKINKVTKLIGIYVIIIFSTVFMMKMLIYDTSPASYTYQLKRPKPNQLIIILSQPRSGSSWIGSFFDEHPDVFYVYEPLHPSIYQTSELHMTHAKYQEEILTNLCSCQFSPQVVAHGFHDRSVKVEGAKGMMKILPPDSDMLQQSCKGSSYTVAKILQLLDKNVISKVAQNCQIEIVHLVRDPRASIKSRIDTFHRFKPGDVEIDDFTPELVRNASKTICNQILERAESLEHLADITSYRKIYFEKFSRDPMKEARAIFKDLDIEWDQAVERRVVRSSTGHAENGGFDTVKDSNKIANAWRRTAEPEFIKAVESSCGDMMKKFGYSQMFPS